VNLGQARAATSHYAFRGLSRKAERSGAGRRGKLVGHQPGVKGKDFDQIRAHRHDEIRQSLWPWLRQRQYAGPEDDQQLDAFLRRLGRRDAHLRPGIEIRRIWAWAHAVDLDERGALVGEVCTAVCELLTALDEPLPPACASVAGSSTISELLQFVYARQRIVSDAGRLLDWRRPIVPRPALALPQGNLMAGSFCWPVAIAAPRTWHRNHDGLRRSAALSAETPRPSASRPAGCNRSSGAVT